MYRRRFGFIGRRPPDAPGDFPPVVVGSAIGVVALIPDYRLIRLVSISLQIFSLFRNYADENVLQF